MSKKTLQDIVPPEKRSIRHIPLPDRKNDTKDHHRDDSTKKSSKKHERSASLNRRVNFNFVKKITIPLVIVSIIVITAFFMSFVFSGATVKVYPKKQIVSISSNILAGKEVGSDISYEVLKSVATTSMQVVASGEEMVERKASGRIIIYNNFSTEPQRLITKTRFQSSNGLIYRINESVVVPGQKKVGGDIIPGSIEVTIYADFGGDEYNLKLSDLKGDFTIPGFKGTPRYDAFYGRLKTDITGGYSGMEKKVSDSVLKESRVRLQDELKKQIVGSLSQNLDKEIVFFEDAIFYNFESLPNQAVPNSNDAILTEKAVANVIVFKRDDLVIALMKKSLKDYDPEEKVSIPELESLNVSIQTGNQDIFAILNSKKINIAFKGQVPAVWNVDVELLKRDLAGKMKNDISRIVSSYPSVSKTEVVLRPFWRQTVVNNPNKINIDIQ